MPYDGASSPESLTLQTEQCLIGIVLFDNAARAHARFVEPQHFLEPVHALAWETICETIDAGAVADPLLLSLKLNDVGAFQDLGGVTYLLDAVDAAPPTNSAPSYAEAIVGQAVRRDLAAIGRDQGGDVSEQLRRLADAAVLRATARIAPTPFSWRSPSEIPTRRWLYGRHLIRGYVSCTVAPGGLGKSSLVLSEAIAMATGRELIGERPYGRFKVWFWNGEDPRDEIERRTAAAVMALRVKPSELEGQLFIDSGRDTPIVLARMTRDGFVLDEGLVSSIIASIRERQIDVMTVDPFVATHSVPENDNGAIDALVKRGWARIAHATGCAIELVHHVSKGVQGQDTVVESARGASALIAAARSARVLNVMSEEEAVRANVENRFAHFRVDNGKANLAPRTGASIWRQIIGVDLGNGDPGPSDSVGAVVDWRFPGLLDGLTAQSLFAVQKAVSAAEWRLDPQAKAWVGQAVAGALALDDSDKAVRKRIAEMVKVWIGTGALKVVESHDEKRMPKQFVHVGEWVVIGG